MEKDDKEFEPTIEMMIHDFDDEQTLEEEERQAAAEANDNELDDLQRESDMPLEQLLAMYYNQPMGTNQDDDSFDEEEILLGDTSKKSDDKTGEMDTNAADSDAEDESELKRLYPKGVNSLNEILAAAEESDCDYEPDESDNRKKIMVGSEHQAQIPEYGAPANDSGYDENEDKLIWSGTEMAPEDIVEYLQKIKQLCPPRSTENTWTAGEVAPETTTRHVRDDEKALSLLRECGNNVEEAINRIKAEMNPGVETCWSEEECENFEAGLLAHGKNFHEIKASKVPSKTVGEIIQFYYHWKKSERYDAFVSKNRVDKKKYNANSGPCIMDRFLDDQEGTSTTGTNGMHLRDRNLLTVNNSLLSADAKRRHDKHEPQSHTSSNDPVD